MARRALSIAAIPIFAEFALTDTDSTIREVDDALREERTMRLVKTAAPALAVAFVLITGGVLGRQYWAGERERAAEAEAEIFVAAAEAGDREAFDALISGASTGYGALARLREANLLKARGERAAAADVLGALARDGRATLALRRFATVQAAALVLGRESYEAMEARLAAVSLLESALGARAREILAFAAWEDGRLDEARTIFTDLVDDRALDARVADRAAAMLELLAVASPSGTVDPAAANEGSGQAGGGSEDPS